MKDGRKKGTPSGRTGLRRQSNKPRAASPPGKKTRKVAGDKSQWFRKAYEDSPIAIELFDARGLLLEVNRACLELFGVKDIEEIKGFELFEDPNISARVKKRLLAGETVRYDAPFDFGKVKKARLYSTRKSGVAHLDVLITPLRIGRKTINGYLVQVLDVTKRKKAEEALRKSGIRLEEKVAERTAELRREVAERRRAEAEISSVYNAISDMITVQDTDYRILSYNKVVEETFGAGLEGRLCYEAYQGRSKICPDCPVVLCFEDGGVHVAEKSVLTDRGLRHMEITASPLRDSTGEIIAGIEIVRDITTRKEAEEALKEREERFRKVFEEGPLGMASLNLEGRFLKANSVFCEMMGYSEQELRGMTARDISHPERAEPDRELIRQLFAGEIPFIKVEKRYVRKGGEAFWGAVTASIIRDDAGKPLYTLAMVEDVTARKQADEALRQSEEFLNDLIDGVADPIMVIGSDYKVKLMNRVARELAGVGRDLPEAPLCHRLSHHSDVPCSETGGNCPMAEVQKTGRPATVVHVHHAHDGELRYVEIIASPLAGPDGSFAGIIESSRDITERKRAEELLKQSETKYRNLVELTSDIIYLSDSRGNPRFMNDAAYRMLEAAPEEVIGQPWDRWVHPEDRERTVLKFREMVETGTDLFNFESRNVSKSGRVYTILHNVRVLRNDEGEIVGTQGIARDITERRETEKALEESEQRYSSFVRNFQGIAFRGRIDFVPLFFHGAVEEITGYAENDFLAGSPRWDQIIHEDDLPVLIEKGSKLSEVPDVSITREYRIIRKDGGVRWLYESIHNVCDASGKPSFVEGAIYDITERKQAEESLRLFSEALEEAPDGIQIVGLNGLIMYSNKAIQEIFGYHPEETIGRHVNMMCVDTEFASRVVIPALQRTGRWAGEVMLRRKDGSEFPVWLTTSMVTDDRGEPIAMVGVSRDITERRTMEEEIKASNARLSALIESIPDAVIFKDARGRHLLINRACEEMFHLRKEDVLGRTVEECMTPALAAHCRISDDEATSAPAPQRTEEHVGDGPEKLYLDTIKSPIRDESGNLVGLVGISRDITERRKMEDALKGLNARLSALIEAIPDAVMFKDARGRHLLINRACEEMFHFKKEDLLGKTVEEFLPPAVAAHCRRSDDEAASAPAPVRTEERVGDGPEELWLDTIKSPIRDEKGEVGGLVAVSRDITERKRMEEALKKSLEEKEMLIKEVHHRVKNNLALVTSLLSLQSRAVKDEGAKRLFIESTNRVRAMSAIHEQLYRSGEPSGIDFRDYVSRLVKDVVSSFERHPGIGLDLDIADVKLDMDTVVPCALIINELVTNAYKHAFRDGEGGRLGTSFQPADDGAYVLSVKDDGVGFPESLDFRRATSMGMQIVTALAQQLGGDIELLRDGGTEFRITFPNRPNRKTSGGK